MGGTKVFVGDVLRQEVTSALKLENRKEVEVIAYPTWPPVPCSPMEALQAELDKLKDDAEVVILGSEFLTAAPPNIPSHWIFVAVGECAELLLGPHRLKELRRKAAALLTPGMLSKWKESGAMAPPWLLHEDDDAADRETIVLDTGTHEDLVNELKDVKTLSRSPIYLIPCDLDYLRLQLSRALMETALLGQLERARLEAKAQARLRSDYALALDLLQKMSHSNNESEVIGSIMDVLSMLFSPAEADYYSITEEGEVLVFDYAEGELMKVEDLTPEDVLSHAGEWDEASEGFKLKIEDKNQAVGVACLRHLAAPEFHKSYLELAWQLSTIFGLAVANARTYQSLREAEREMERAFALERTMLEISQGLFARQEFDKGVHDALGRAAEAMGASRALLFRFSRDMTKLCVTHEWHSPEIPSAKEFFSQIAITKRGWLNESLQAEGTVRLMDLDSTDQGLGPEIEPFRRAGARSMALTSLAGDGKQQGLVCMMHTRPSQNFEADEANLLRFLGQTISLALQKKKNQEDLADMAEAVSMSNKVLRHDIRNELMVLTGSLQIYEMKRDNKHLERAKRSAARLVEILEHFKELDLFLQSSKGLFAVELEEAIKEAMAHHQINYNIKGKGKVLADYAINSIFDNLARNSVKHGEAKNLDFIIGQQGPFVELLISDDGRGIPPEIRPRLFQEGFSYGQVRGTGLGLFWIKRTMERYGGWARFVESERGATFSLGFLPA
ncbi:MAG: GAF domain-containing sensor histidine kinase [Methanomassiliicoccales archaeon]